MVLDRHKTRLDQPKAHAINPRSLEILRQAGFNTKALREAGLSAEESFWVRVVTGMTGSEMAKLPYERQDEAVRAVTPEPLFNVGQPLLESFLQEEALKTGLVSIHRGWNWEALSQVEESRIVSTVRNRQDSSDEVKIASEYVIGTDGADSSVRAKTMDICWEAPPGMNRGKSFYRSIHVKADLKSTLINLQRAGQLFFCIHPDHPGGMIMYDLSSSFVHVARIDPSRDPAEQSTEESCRASVRACIGPEIPFQVLSVTSWYTWPRIASSYSSNGHRILLAGDSAHSFPPQGGLGINTGIADAHNLVWKLALVLNGAENIREHLLGTYTAERKPVAVANAIQSGYNEKRWTEFNELTSQLAEIAKEESGDTEANLSRQRNKDRVAEALLLNKPHFDSLALQLGYIYNQGDGSGMLSDCGDFRPSATPGARLPHAWIGAGLSTLDLVPMDKFLLIYNEIKFSLSICPRDITVEIVPLNVNEYQFPKPWLELMGLISAKGVLVRPDQHILAHVTSDQQLEKELRQYLGL